MTAEMTNKNSSQEADEMDLGRLIGELIDYRKLIFAITVGFTGIGILYAFFATPIYQANALIQVEQKQGNAILRSLSQMLPDSQPQSAPEIALLQSRMILGKTVDDLNLQTKIEEDYFPLFGKGFSRILGHKEGQVLIGNISLPESNDEITELEMTVVNDKTYEISGNDFTAIGKVGETLHKQGYEILINEINAEPGTRFSISYLSRLKAINNLQEAFNVADQGKDTGVLNLTLTGENPILVAKILDSISQNYLAQNVARQAAQDAKSLEFLDQQLPKVRSDLDIAEDKLNAYRKQKDSVDLTMEAKTVLDQIVNVDNQLNELTFKEAEISQLYTQEHPTYKALMEKRKTLQQEKSKLNKRVSTMPSTQQEVLRLSRDVESGRAVYLQLLNRQQELNIAKSSAIGNVRIIDDAVPLPKPVKPKKIVVVLVSFILGLFFSLSFVLLRVFLRRGIESPEQLEDIGISVYAGIPVSESLSKDNKRSGSKRKQENSVLLALENPADLAIEAIRSLRTSLHFAMMEAKNNVLMISGASPDAGKTFVSSNLAVIMAHAGSKVLYIDADMRKGYAHKLFGTDKNKGLSDILSGKCSVKDAITNLPNAGFDYIPRGQVPPNPAELLMHPRFEALLGEVSKNYDLIIVDTPPILAVTDAAVIGRYAGTTLIVARFEKDTVKEISVSMKRFQQSGTIVKGCILNGIVKKASSYYGYGYNYYGYSYSDKK
ncbi:MULTISPECIES: polysaccharide biosynthesis tyrosine autokinase [Klebsiella pneumoniae complex]|uniref:polysaccharide biosynthesis tyrosine autokinase n=1 Tax=Klebsiella pneumoniae complex TaxID=3390273 RepID=UPI000EF1A230|nr:MULTISPECIES: polysaccharide biosynthesis tyrosine autokinase [Klebsiella]MBC4813444.1 polysaccharide biosynthesis tyrosine autokinase [Klebsiella quasipneumoniae]MDL4023509.1 polysaccharide biosynthesis tyrosine autokinase [Klebsiella quasipneumoniae]MDZ3229923.1 polysaccharide biosynthesis tyrosine autokinase [Klebsiella quasipneumoniae]MDZ3235222.1 polysaccharide biosynthesis tyrosine autokinase [Klebsiella quasipneumoniae]NBI26932.1 polysaccharide biosynthesis tyrosine autokinase [Klebs